MRLRIGTSLFIFANLRAEMINPVWATLRCCGRALMPLKCQKRINLSLVSIPAKRLSSHSAPEFGWPQGKPLPDLEQFVDRSIVNDVLKEMGRKSGRK